MEEPTSEKNRGLIRPAIWLGAASGAGAAALGVVVEELSLLLFALLPGVVFGLVLGWFFWRRGVIGWRLATALVIGASVGNHLGFRAAMHGYAGLQSALGDQLGAFLASGVVGGLVGSLVCVFASLPAWSPRRAWMPVAVGTALGILGPLAMTVGWGGMIGFYALWQAGFAAALALALASRSPVGGTRPA